MPLAAFPKCFLDALCVRRDMTVDEWIDLSIPLDVDGLEFYSGFLPDNDPVEWDRLRRKVAQQNRSIPMMCHSSDFTRPTPAERQQEVERQKRAIRATAALGGAYCRVLSGQRRPEVTREQGFAWVRECIVELLPFAEANRVVLVIENHYKDGFWEYPEFAQRMDDFLELLDRIPESEWFGVNYDPSNAIIAGDDPIALLEAVKHRVRTMHASDRHFEGGTLEDLRRLEAQPGALRILALIEGVRYLSRNRIPGDVVECGVWRGGSMMAVALTLLAENDTGRRLFLYDTFEGMTAPTEQDRRYDGTPAATLRATEVGPDDAWCGAGIDEVRRALATTGFPESQMHFVPGKVEDTIPAMVPEAIALLRLDTDWYESTRHELQHLYPVVVPRGLVILDDYGYWRGARQATDEYLAGGGFRPLLQRIDATGRLLVKPDLA